MEEKGAGNNQERTCTVKNPTGVWMVINLKNTMEHI